MILFQWHVIFLIAMAYVLGHLVALYPLKSEELRKARLNYVNYGLLLTFGVLCFACVAYMYYPSTEEFPKSILEISYVLWTMTLFGMLWFSTYSRPMKIIAVAPIVATLVLHYLFKGEQRGVSGFINKLDAFTWFSGGESGRGLKLSAFLKFIFFFINSFVVLNYFGRIFQIIHRDRLKDRAETEALQSEAISRLVLVLSFSISLFLALALAGTELRSLSLFSGLVAAGVSVALKDLLANMAAGILLLWDKSIKTNDVIALDKERFGIVKSMTMRYLVLEDRNDIRFLVPNSELITTTITNWTQRSRRIRLKLEIGVAFDSDPAKVRRIIKETCLRVARVLQDPPPRVLILGVGDSAINFQLRFFIGDPENGVRNVTGEIYELLLLRFKELGVRVPFPQREFKLLPSAPMAVTFATGDGTDNSDGKRPKRRRNRKKKLSAN